LVCWPMCEQIQENYAQKQTKTPNILIEKDPGYYSGILSLSINPLFFQFRREGGVCALTVRVPLRVQ